MKLLDVLKKYDRCVLRESAKLTKIYNAILRESEEVDDLDEATCPDCGNDPCTCESEKTTDEAEEIMSAEEFFNETDKECDECDTSKSKTEDVDESEEVEENDMLRNRPHNAHIDDPAGIKESETEEDFETIETINFNEDGDVELDDDDVINESIMKLWCDQSIETR